MGRFVLLSGMREACLTFNIEGDDLFEGDESLTGLLRGVSMTPEGTVIENPPRITISPEETTLVIEDSTDDG